MLIEVLLALQTVSTDRHAVVGRVDDIRVVEFAHFFELFQNSTNLDIDIFATGELTTEFIADGAFVPFFPHAADGDFITQAGMAVVERMLRQIIDRQGRLLRIGRREILLVFVIDCSVLREQLRSPVSRVVRVRKTEVDQERLLVPAGLAIVQVVRDLITVPDAAGFVGAASFCGVVSNRELLVAPS